MQRAREVEHANALPEDSARATPDDATQVHARRKRRQRSEPLLRAPACLLDRRLRPALCRRAHDYATLCERARGLGERAVLPTKLSRSWTSRLSRAAGATALKNYGRQGE